MKTLGLFLVTIVLAGALADEGTINLLYKGPLPTYQVPYDKDISYTIQSVPYLFDYLPPVLPKASWNDPKIQQLTKSLADSSDLQGRIDFCPRINNLNCDPYYWFRQPDGTCNNLNITWWGGANTPSKRIYQPQYQDGVQTPRVLGVTGRRLKNPREIARKVHYPHDIKKDVSQYVSVFGQFAMHDVSELAHTLGENGQTIACSCETSSPDCFNIELSGDDYMYKNQKCQVQARLRDSRVDFDCDLGYRNTLNKATSFVDASQVYGNSKEIETDLRAFYGGRMHVSYFKDTNGPLLPHRCKANTFIETTKTNVCFVAGDDRVNENPLLTGMHVIFLRLHNLYAAKLAKANPFWDDERLFQEAKRLTTAVYQHIVYAEWLPLVIGYELHKAFDLESRVYDFFTGYDERVYPGTSVEFSVAAARFGHTLVPSTFTKTDANYHPLSNVTLRYALFRSDLILKGDNLDQFMRGCLHDRALQNSPHVTEEMFDWMIIDQGNNNPTKFFSLPAFNINRGRDVGLPPYVHYRSLAGLNFPYNFDELSWISPQKIKRLKASYYNVLDIDLYAGGLSEHHVRGGLVGPTFAYIIARGFRDWKYGDRWFYENSPSTTPLAFTLPQLTSIKNMKLSSVLCSTLNIKELPKNVFLKADKAHNPVVPCSAIMQLDFNLFAAVPDDTKWNSPWAQPPPEGSNPINPYAETNPANWIYPGQAPGYQFDSGNIYSKYVPNYGNVETTYTTTTAPTTTTTTPSTTTTVPVAV